MCDHVFFAHRILNVLFQQLQIQQVGNAQAASPHLVFVGRTDSTRSGADLDASGSVLRRKFDHAMVRKNHLGAVRDEKIPVDLHTRLAQRAHFFKKGHGIEDHAIADHASAGLTQHAAGDKLQHKLLALDDDRMPGIVAAGIAGYYRKILGKNIDDFAFAFIAPLGADDYRGLAFFQFPLRGKEFAHTHACAAAGGRTQPRPVQQSSQIVTRD